MQLSRFTTFEIHGLAMHNNGQNMSPVVDTSLLLHNFSPHHVPPNARPEGAADPKQRARFAPLALNLNQNGGGLKAKPAR